MTVLTAALVSLLLLWFGTLTAVVGADDPWPSSAAADFVPADGQRSDATLRLDDAEAVATQEHAHLRGITLSQAMSTPAYVSFELPGEDTHWWRESVYPEADVPHWQRVRSIAADGVRLHAQVWAVHGLAFSPGLLELPADVAAGAEWSSDGTVRAAPDAQVDQQYRNTSRAETPADAAQADRGCLQISSTTQVTGAEEWTWQQDSLWCPEEGMVESTGTQDEATYALSNAAGTSPPALGADHLRDAEPDTTAPDTWQQGVLEVTNGDGTFGEQDLSPSPQGSPVVVAGGAIGYREGASTDLGGMAVLDEELHWTTWWGRPSGQILSLTAVGSLVVATTSEREMIAYDPGGRWYWTAELDDVALAAPVRVGDDLLVATLGGTVERHRAGDGATVWSTRLDRGVALAPSSDGETVAVIDTDDEVHGLDARTGEELWSRSFAGPPEGIEVRDRTVLVSNYARLEGWDARTGAHRWQDLTLRWNDALVAGTDQVATLEEGRVRLHDVTTGEVTGEVGGAVDVAFSGDTWFALTAEELLAVDGTGARRASWSLQLPADHRKVVTGGGRVWVFGTEPGDVRLIGEWVGPR